MPCGNSALLITPASAMLAAVAPAVKRMFPFVLATSIVFAAVVLGQDDYRVAQQMALALPGSCG